jgi:hypothetical protein
MLIETNVPNEWQLYDVAKTPSLPSAANIVPGNSGTATMVLVAPLPPQSVIHPTDGPGIGRKRRQDVGFSDAVGEPGKGKQLHT